MFYPHSYQTGEVLEKGEDEIVVSYIVLPTSFAHGFSDKGLELRGFWGWSGWDIGSLGIGVTKSLTKDEKFYTSGTAETEFVFNTEYDFTGMRIIGTYALGYNPIPQFGIYTPIKVAYLFYDFNGEKGGGFSFVPGLGISFEPQKKTVFRIGGNIPSPSLLDENVEQHLWVYVQVVFRW